MTSAEIKSTYSMADIVAMYGLKPNRQGYIACPFHGEKTASMLIKPKNFHCFGCGEHGDIFDFIQKYEGITFKDAFLMLGGGYDSTPEAKQHVKALKERQEKERRNRERRQAELMGIIELLSYYRLILAITRPLSPLWCDVYNLLQKSTIKYNNIIERGDNT